MSQELLKRQIHLRVQTNGVPKTMTLGSMKHIPLASAYLCQDCSNICNNSRQCPVCASEVLMGLAGVLDREPEEKARLKFLWPPALAA
jgi:hypothetical protein